MFIQGQAHSQAKFGIIFKERIRPGWSASFLIMCPWGCGQVATIDGRAAGGIGHQGAVAKELGEQFDIRSLATARAGARELKQRLEKLGIFDCGRSEERSVRFGKPQEKFPVLLPVRAGAVDQPC